MLKKNSNSAEKLLLLGTILGALLATTSLLEPSSISDIENAAAIVDGESVTKSEYLSFLELLAKDKRNPVTAVDRERVLNRIIEERLLIEKGLEIGVAQSDPSVRKAIVRAMIETVTSEASIVEPEESELRKFYSDNQSYFTTAARLQARRMIFKGEDAKARAEIAHAQLANTAWEQVVIERADDDILSLPSSPLPLNKMRGYLGPSLTETLLSMNINSYSEPQWVQNQAIILHLINRSDSPAPELSVIKEETTREYQRRASDEALRVYLTQLRTEADIEINSKFMDQLNQPGFKTE